MQNKEACVLYGIHNIHISCNIHIDVDSLDNLLDSEEGLEHFSIIDGKRRSASCQMEANKHLNQRS